MSRIKLTIEYVGTDFCGWQSQKNGVSVQDVLERALGIYFGCDFVRTHAAGRTDKGVHAKGQTVHFDVDKPVNLYKLCLGLNVALPQTVAVTDAQVVPQNFDARFSATSKTYCYRLYASPVRHPTLDVNHAQVYKMPDVHKMREAAQLLVGTHDFAAFQKVGSNLKGTVRTVNSLEIRQPQPDVLEFWINGNAFLYNQVRITCGLLVEVGKGRFGLTDVTDMLNGRKLTFKTLPARGLTLEKVFYDSEDDTL